MNDTVKTSVLAMQTIAPMSRRAAVRMLGFRQATAIRPGKAQLQTKNTHVKSGVPSKYSMPEKPNKQTV